MYSVFPVYVNYFSDYILHVVKGTDSPEPWCCPRIASPIPLRLPRNFSLEALEDPQNFAATLRNLYQTKWVVYAKPPFGSPEQVYKYLAGYTHRVAISNHRLVSLSNDQVSFRWQDRAKGNRKRLMALDAVEFIRRFLLHVLPKGFVRIRQYGFLANRARSKALAHCRELIMVECTAEPDCVVVTITPFDNRITCPECKTGHLVCGAELSWIAIQILDSS